MGRKQASVTLLAVGLLLAPFGSAAARTTARESFKGTVIASGASGTRTVVSSLIVARGVFNGVGRVVEVENRPGDPDNSAATSSCFRRARCASGTATSRRSCHSIRRRARTP